MNQISDPWGKYWPISPLLFSRLVNSWTLSQLILGAVGSSLNNSRMIPSIAAVVKFENCSQTVNPDLLSTSLTMALRYLDKCWDFSHYPQGGLDLRYEGKSLSVTRLLTEKQTICQLITCHLSVRIFY